MCITGDYETPICILSDSEFYADFIRGNTLDVDVEDGSTVRMLKIMFFRIWKI
jgi:hypothetical protein